MWMKTARPSLEKQWTGELARGFTASRLREVIATMEAAKTSTTQRQRGEQKYVFTLDDAMFFVSLKIQTHFLDLKQMLQVLWTPLSLLSSSSLTFPFPCFLVLAVPTDNLRQRLLSIYICGKVKSSN